MVWCHEIARFHISNPSPPHKSRADLWKCRCFCDSEISGWHIKFKNSSSSRVLYSSAADFWEKNAQLFTEAVEKLSQTKIFESWCYASRKWVNKNASWEGSLPTSNPRSPVGLRVQGFTSVFIVSCWKSNRRLKLTLNHINHLIYIYYIYVVYIKSGSPYYLIYLQLAQVESAQQLNINIDLRYCYFRQSWCNEMWPAILPLPPMRSCVYLPGELGKSIGDPEIPKISAVFTGIFYKISS